MAVKRVCPMCGCDEDIRAVLNEWADGVMVARCSCPEGHIWDEITNPQRSYVYNVTVEDMGAHRVHQKKA